MPYGIANKRGKISKDEVFEILDYAYNAGIECIDTAPSYGESEEVIGEFLSPEKHNFKIISKTPEFDRFSKDALRDALQGILTRLNRESIEGCLIHRFDDFMKYDELWSALVDFKREGFIGEIGFSLYSVEELRIVLDRKLNIDIINIPYSVFDRRFEPYLKELKALNIKVVARSIFLQGLPSLERDSLKGSLVKTTPSLNALGELEVNNSISRYAMCLNFALLNPYIDKVVIGVDTLDHLIDNLKSLDLIDVVRGIYGSLAGLKIDHEEVVSPKRWSLV